MYKVGERAESPHFSDNMDVVSQENINLGNETQIYINNSVALVAFAILVYDYSITFDDEYRYIWCFPRGRVSIVYWLTRYVSLGLNVIWIYTLFSSDLSPQLRGIYTLSSNNSRSHPSTCRRFVTTIHPLSTTTLSLLFERIAVQVLRTCAIYRMHIYAVAVTSLLTTGISVIFIWALAGPKQLTGVEISIGCHSIVTTNTAIYLAAPWEALAFFDFFVFMMTVTKTYRERGNRLSHNKHIWSLILRDGK
ncbi:hypothetical protein PHLGIDRAFT_340423 [Phlebiopsis gigantea 11061_1 CR5-6]|uniref:DUF6533 domain-containing protein n=1 Tax=Phlebiopsis gigantea (strain 11061_1 CR5-6) TaxID=745531 RepID=A0A0C3NVD9_PHLG1|nr:hypothetical protein PHLGIDRAFT_340423 [Phlebiopsis gigantea 11061_1 CR5-6]